MGTKNYTLKRGVKLAATVEKKVAKIADAYNKKTGATIVVTSGTRSPSSQASAMEPKLKKGDVKIYRNKKAAKAILDAYKKAIDAGKTKSAAVKAAAKVIADQVKKGTYISKHLRKGAVDIRSRDMNAKQKKAFREAAKAEAKTVILEKTPPHWHLQF